MRGPRRWWWVAAGVLALLVATPLIVYSGLSYEPSFYRELLQVSPQARKSKADRFVSNSLQLRNDIVNEERWEAVFSQDEVNAWLTEELVGHFSDQLPPQVSDPVVAFGLDHITLAFKMDQGPVRSLVWVVARARVVPGNKIALTLEKTRAGFLPVPPDPILDHLVARGRANGLEVEWTKEDGEPVAYIGYSPAPGRMDVVLETVRVLDGQLYISGRSKRSEGRVIQISLPGRSALQSTFPVRRNFHRGGPPSSPSARKNHASPVT